MTLQTATITADQTGRILLAAPYNPELSPKAKMLGGKWNPSLKAWSFDPRDRARVEALAAQLFGWNPDASGEVTTIRIHARKHQKENRILLAGQEIAIRETRDSPVVLEDGVILVDGEFPDSGGSHNRPMIDADSSVILEIRDLPLELVSKLDPAKYETVNETIAPTRALEEERERLLARIAEIDAQLAKDQK